MDNKEIKSYDDFVKLVTNLDQVIKNFENDLVKLSTKEEYLNKIGELIPVLNSRMTLQVGFTFYKYYMKDISLYELFNFYLKDYVELVDKGFIGNLSKYSNTMIKDLIGILFVGDKDYISDLSLYIYSKLVKKYGN